MKKIEEVRYLDTKAYNVPREKPLKDTETIRVYHGFYSYETALEVLKKGLSGKERARRIYSFESGNNPYGLFVSVDFKAATKFASSGIIIEFSSKVSDLEAPVWVGGRSYFIQGEYTQSFKDLDEREQQRLLNRQRAGESPYDSISKSDRPELAETLFDNAERQALYIGDLNPNMIKRVWYNETRHVKRLTNGPWEKYSVNDFLNYKKEYKSKKGKRIKFYPNDDFTIEKFASFLDRDEDLKIYLDQIINYDLDSDYTLKNYGFWPKQVKQIRDLHSKGYFDKYLNESKILNEIGDASAKNYEYKLAYYTPKFNETTFSFKTDSDIEYNVIIEKEYDDELKKTGIDVSFGVDENYDKVLNKGELYKVMSTVFKIVKDFITKDNEIEYISYNPSKKTDIENLNTNQRNLLYKKFIQQHIPNVKFIQHVNTVYALLNESKLINIIKEELDNIKKELGSGIHGNAIKKGDKVYKITNSKNEYDISKKIKDSNIEFNTLPKIYGIRILENNKYLIIRDFINNEISDDLGELIGGEIDEIIQFFMEKTINVKNSQTNLTELFDSKFLSFLEELKKELNQLGYVRSFDIFGLSNNIGIDKNNNYKLFDF
jgi:hypothetical protein